jgi:hypothetical protein
MDSENAHRCAQYAKTGFHFDLFFRYHEDVDEFLYLSDDEPWVPFFSIETIQ